MRITALCVALLLAVWAAPSAYPQVEGGGAREVFPFYGTVSGSSVRLRGGPADYHAILSELERGQLLKVHGAEGEWYEVELPGGLALYACGRLAGSEYIKEERAGRGVVQVATLNVRGTADMDHPPVTQLKAGDRVVVLDEKEGWFRIVAPPGTHAWVHRDYVKIVPDQKAAATLFVSKHVEAERNLLQSGAHSSKMLVAEAQAEMRKADARKAFESYDQEKAKQAGVRDINRIREELASVRDRTRSGDPDHARATALLQTLDDWTRLKKGWEELERKRLEARKQANTRYSEELAALRKEMEENRKREEARTAGRNTMNGWIRRVFPVGGVVGKGPNYALFRGNQKQFLLESDRYDLSDYTDKLVLVLNSAEPEQRPGVDLRVVKITKLEILDGER